MEAEVLYKGRTEMIPGVFFVAVISAFYVGWV